MRIEPTAAECFEKARADYGALGKPVPHETMLYLMALSQAESLKRIADAFCGVEDTAGVLELLNPLQVRNNY